MRNPLRLTLTALLLFAPPALAGKPLDAETLWKIQRLASPSISPDGSWVVLPVTSYDVKEDKALTDLWLVATTGGEVRRLTTHEGSDTSPAFSPDGNWIAFEARRGDDESGQIYVISTSGGEARRLTAIPTGASSAKWFPDSKRVAFVSRVWADLKSWEDQGKRQKERKESKVSAKVWDKTRIRYWDHFIDDREAHVYSIGIEGGEPAPITFGSGRALMDLELSSGLYDISPDGNEVAFVSDTDTTGVNSNPDIYSVPASGGTARNLTEDNPAADSDPLYSPDGRLLAFGRQTIKGFYGDRVRLVLHDRNGGGNRILTDAWDRSVSNLVWTSESTGLYGSIDDAGRNRLYHVDARSGEPRRVTQERSFTSPALSRDGKVLVALRQAFDEPPTLVRVDPASGEVTKLSRFNDALLEEVEWGSYESVTFKGARGEPVQMWVVYPPGFDRSKKWPAYVLLHGGPHNGVTDGFQFRWNAQVFSAWGYVTAWPNFHGSSGFGQAFTDSINPDTAELPYEDVLRAAGWLEGKDWIDAERMAAGGGSYGGFLASVILGRKHPFKSMIAHAAVYNLYTQHGADYGAEKRRFGEFWEKPEIVARNSPHLRAKNFTTPTLVIHGEKDYRVPVNHGIELFQTLQNRGVRSRLIYYPDENHWVLKPQNSLFWYAECKKWLEEFIGSGPTAETKLAQAGGVTDLPGWDRR